MAVKTTTDQASADTKEMVLTLYPYPSKGVTHLSVNCGTGRVDVMIMNTVGQIVDRRMVDEKSDAKLGLMDLPSGTYFLWARGEVNRVRTIAVKIER